MKTKHTQKHTLMNISTIPNHHLNVYKHTVYDPPHLIALMNGTYLYINNPTLHSNQFTTTQNQIKKQQQQVNNNENV